MDLISKIKRASVLSVVAMSAVVLSGGLSTSAMNPSGYVSTAREVKFADFSSVGGCVLQTIRQLGGKPAMILVPKMNYSMGDEVSVAIPQIVGPSRKVSLVHQKISLIGKPIPISAIELASKGNEVMVLAYIPQTKGLCNEPVSIFIPQVIEIGGKSFLIYLPQSVNMIGIPMHPYDKLNVVPTAAPTTVMMHASPMKERKAPSIPKEVEKQMMAVLSSRTLVNPQANQLRAYDRSVKNFVEKFSGRVEASKEVNVPETPLPSYASVFGNAPVKNSSTVERDSLPKNLSEHRSKFFNGVELFRRLNPSEEYSPYLASTNSNLSREDFVTPKRNKVNPNEIPPIGYLAPKPARKNVSFLHRNDEVSRRLDFSEDSREQLPKIPLNEANNNDVEREHKNYITPRKNNGVQKTTLQNPKESISALCSEAKKVREKADDISPAFIYLSDSQSEIETDIECNSDIPDSDEDTQELISTQKSDKNKK